MKDAKHESDVGFNKKEQSMNRITQKVHVWREGSRRDREQQPGY